MLHVPMRAYNFRNQEYTERLVMGGVGIMIYIHPYLDAQKIIRDEQPTESSTVPKKHPAPENRALPFPPTVIFPSPPPST